MTCWASSALSHFLLSKKQNKWKQEHGLVWRQRETTVDLTLDFQLPTSFLFLFCFGFFFWCCCYFSLTVCTLGAEKETPSQPISPPGLKKKTTHLLLSVWTLNPVLSHVSHVKAYQVLVRIEARRRAQQEEPTCSLYWRTYTHKRIHTAHTQIHDSF